jgi:hypothetical protein
MYRFAIVASQVMFQLYLPVFSWLKREISLLISRSFDLVGMVVSGIDTPALRFVLAEARQLAYEPGSKIAPS